MKSCYHSSDYRSQVLLFAMTARVGMKLVLHLISHDIAFVRRAVSPSVCQPMRRSFGGSAAGVNCFLMGGNMHLLCMDFWSSTTVHLSQIQRADIFY